MSQLYTFWITSFFKISLHNNYQTGSSNLKFFKRLESFGLLFKKLHQFNGCIETFVTDWIPCSVKRVTFVTVELRTPFWSISKITQIFHLFSSRIISLFSVGTRDTWVGCFTVAFACHTTRTCNIMIVI